MARASRRGSQALEFALLMPVLLVIVAGVVDYGYYLSFQHKLVVATQESLRDGAMASALQDPVVMAEARAATALEDAGLTDRVSSISAETIGSTPDMAIRVTIELSFEPLVGLVPVPETLSSSLAAHLWYQPKAVPPEI